MFICCRNCQGDSQWLDSRAGLSAYIDLNAHKDTKQEANVVESELVRSGGEPGTFDLITITLRRVYVGGCVVS